MHTSSGNPRLCPRSDPDDSEQHRADRLNGGRDRPGPFTDDDEGDPEEDGKQQDRQHRPLCEALHDGGREDLGEVVVPLQGRSSIGSLGRRTAEGQLCGVGPDATTRAHDVDHDETQDQSRGGDHLEVHDRPEGHLADAAEVGDRGDTCYDHAEDDGVEHHRQQADEGVTQGAQSHADVGGEKSGGRA
ncbi:hypothetical protein OG218_08260 [Kineococcus sp. NBC_00420]